MAERLLNLCAALQARPRLLGWRAGTPVSSESWLADTAAWRTALAVHPGRNVALYTEDSLAFAAALFGAWHAGKTVWLAADTLPATCAALAHQVDAFIGQFPPEYPVLSVVDAGDGGWSALDAALPALVVYTSGTTGAPQAIPKTLAQLANETTTLETQFSALLGDCAVIATVSHQHIYGLLFKVLWPLTGGRPVHTLSVAYPEQLPALLTAQPAVLVTSPAQLKRLPAHLPWASAQASLRAVFSSGGPLPPESALAAGALLGVTPTEVYGSSETGGIAWRRRASLLDHGWQALPGVQWRIEPDGALAVRSPHLPDDGWMALADRAYEQAGRFVLSGRLDRIVKLEEKRVSLDALEARLRETGLVREARVFVAPPAAGEDGRERMAACVVLNEDGQALLDQDGKRAVNRTLRHALAEVAETVALPRLWRYVEQLPVDAQGKTTQALLLALLAERPRWPQVQALELSATRVEMTLLVPPDLAWFDGHFPEAPVLAGVVQVDWAIAYARRYFEVPPNFKAMHALKFQQVIGAAQQVILELQFERDTLAFRYFSGAGPHSSGRVLFAQD
ncbi:MAG TPA: AMP-binding protein [Burkholderiaceae bacterium]